MNPNYFRKGFTDPSLHEAFIQAVADGDCAEIAAVVQAARIERLPADAMILGMPRAMAANSRALNDSSLHTAPEFGTADYLEGLELIHELAGMRDRPLSDNDDSLPEGYRVVSPWLADTEVLKYPSGVDFGGNAQSHAEIQSGRIQEAIDTDDYTLIETGRDAASFVHSDNPITPWLRLAEDAIADGAALKMGASVQTKLPGQSNFVTYGFPFVLGVLGKALEQAGYLSFTLKWRDFAPRPEESSPVLNKGYLTVAYPEGSPMHCSDPAMHSMAACVAKHVLLKLLDGSHVFEETGRSLKQEAELLADNVGYFRVHAGVHFPWEHTHADARAAVLAEEICRAYQL